MKDYARILLSLAVFVVFMAGCGGKKEPDQAMPSVRPVKTMVIGGAVAGRRNYPGTVQAAQRAELSFRVGGPLIELSVREGQKVSKGDLLARIDPRDFEIRLAQEQASFEKAEADYKRYQQLYEKQSVSLQDLELRKAQRDVAKAKLDDARAALNDTYLRAPFAGEVGERYVENREEVTAKQAILSLHDVTGIEIVVNVPETDRALFDPNRDLDVKIWATFGFAPGREFDLELKELASSADPRTQTYRATFVMPQPEGVNVQPGMTANVMGQAEGTTGGEGTGVVVIPVAAVFAGDTGEQFVWVVEPGDMTVHQRKIDVGEVTGTGSIRILGGLSPGERIAVAAVHHLREGMKIRLMDDQAKGNGQ